MPVPKRKLSKSKGRTRRSQQNLSWTHLKNCTNCEELIKPHMVCPKCGFYKDKNIMGSDN